MHTSAASLLVTLILPLLGFADNSHFEASLRRRVNHRHRSGVSRSLESRDRATFYEAGTYVSAFHFIHAQHLHSTRLIPVAHVVRPIRTATLSSR